MLQGTGAYQVVAWLEALVSLDPSKDQRTRAIDVFEMQLQRDPENELSTLINVARRLEAPVEMFLEFETLRRAFEGPAAATVPPPTAAQASNGRIP